jgi:hypothetical protein
MHVESKLRKPLITGGKTLHDVSEDISKRVLPPVINGFLSLDSTCMLSYFFISNFS